MAAVDSERSYEFADQYLLPYFPSKYRDVMVTDLKNAEEFILKTVHELFQSGKYKGNRVVEVGCGPTIHRLATPSKYYDEIITSDYAPENKESVKKWIAGDPQALDWTPLLEIVAACEGYSDISSGVKEIESRIRQKVKSVIHCDVLKESVFLSEIKDVDLLMTANCLEGACSSREDFASAVKNLGNFVKPGGYIMMLTVIGLSSVEFEGEEVKILSLDEDFVHNTLKEAGFVPDQHFYKENDVPMLDCNGCLLVIAKKL